MLKLCLLDPGSREDGEWYRIRDRRFVLGRSDGDLTMPFDEGLSGIHAELVRRTHENGYRYVLVDLNSTNGTFVRVSKVILRDGQELLIGGRRFAFDAGDDSARETLIPQEHEDDTPLATISWQSQRSAPSDVSGPGLVEITPEGKNGIRLPFRKPTHVIGADPTRSDLVVNEDRFISSVHARVSKTDQERWRIENCNSMNGLWLRVTEMPLELKSEFQISEQRFLVRPL